MAPVVQSLGAPGAGVVGTGRRPAAPFGLSMPAAAAGGAGLLPGPTPLPLPTELHPSLNTSLTLGNGALTGAAANRLWRDWQRADRRYRSYAPWRTLSLTPEQQIVVSQSRANAGRARQVARSTRLNPLKTLGAAALVVEPVSAVVQFRENERKGMEPTENAVRTGLSSVFSLGGAFLAGAACTATGAGVVVAGGCGMAGAMAGSAVGDRAGAVVHDLGVAVDERVIEPVGDAAEDAGESLVEELLGGFGRALGR
jgi:hypothetical protein